MTGWANGMSSEMWAGYKESGRPFGVTFAGKAFSETTLIRIAYAFEQRTKHRKKPVFKG